MFAFAWSPGSLVRMRCGVATPNRAHWPDDMEVDCPRFARCQTGNSRQCCACIGNCCGMWQRLKIEFADNTDRLPGRQNCGLPFRKPNMKGNAYGKQIQGTVVRMNISEQVTEIMTANGPRIKEIFRDVSRRVKVY